MFNTHFLVTRQDITRSSWQDLIHSVGNGVAGVELDGGEDSLTGRGSSSEGSSIGSSSNWGSWEKTSGKTSISCWAESSELSRPLGSGSLSFKSSEESSLGFSDLGGVDNRGSSVDGGNWESSVVDRGNWEVVRSNSESEVISNIVDGVDSSLVSIGVGSSHSSVGISLLLLGRVDVLVSVGKVAELILSLELRADWASDRGGKRSSSNGNGSSSVSGRGSSNGDWGSGISSRGSGISSRGSGNSWGISSSILSSNNGGCSSKSRGSSHGASSEGASIKSSYGGSVGKLGVNSSGHWGSISSSIGSSSSVTVCSVIKTSSSQVLSSDRELSLGSSCGQDGRDDSLDKWALKFLSIRPRIKH